jgi:hypothetical protein
VRLAGESAAPAFITMACALEELGNKPTSQAMMLSFVRTLSKLNQRHSEHALADPYHDVEQVLLQQGASAREILGTTIVERGASSF